MRTIIVTLAALALFVLPSIAQADVPFGTILTNGNLQVQLTAVRWSQLAKHGIPVVPGQQDVVQVNIIAASSDTTVFTVTVTCTVDGTQITKSATRRRASTDPTLIQIPVGTINSSITIQSIKIIEHPDGAESDF
jgi:hypothetical protein